MMNTVEVGQVWGDKDKRMADRRVVVVAIDPRGFVIYREASRLEASGMGRRYRSRTPRFQRAFELLAEPGR